MSGHFAVLADYGFKKPIVKNYFVTSTLIARKAAIEDGALIVYKISRVDQSVWGQKYFGRQYGIFLLRAISFQIEAGIQPVTAVITAIEAESDTKKRGQMQPALEALGGGASLGDALYATNFFDSTIKSILMAGERTGSANAVTSALKYIEDKKTASRAYLMVVFASLMELSTSLTIPPTIDDFLIPWLREHMPKATPEQMQMFSSQLDTLEFNNKIWMYFGDGSVFALGVLWAFWFFDAKARDWITNKILIKVPVLSEWYTADALSRSSGIFSSMIEGGVLIGDAMNTLLKTTDNPIAKTFWGSAKLAIERGASTEKAFGASGLLRKDELLVLAACKGNKQIAKAFKSISEERAWRKKILGARLFKLSIIGMFLHIGITLIIGFRLFGIFNAGLDVNMNNMTQGI